jgi:hypothetical protein
MAIRIFPDPIFIARVEFTVLGQESPEASIWEFHHKSPAALQGWLQTMGETPVDEALSEIVVRWVSGIVDENGDDATFSKSALRTFLLAQATRPGELLYGYVQALQESRVKNSLRPHGE